MSGQHTFLPLILATIIALSLHTASANTAPLITSSAKLRVDAENGHAWGTGTIVDTRQGEALILTCGHIFRESQGKGNIEVHLFGDNSTIRVLGTCLFYDLDIDLALVAVKPPCPVHAVPIAPASYQIKPAQAVSSVGCDHGGNPTVRSHQVMSIDKIYQAKENCVPFHYIQVSGAPVGGRSGGGLFSSEGYLIGVCNTADPVVDDGHFVPPQIIRHILDKMNLADVYTNPSLGEPLHQPAPQLAALAPLAPLESTPTAAPTAAPASPAPMVAANYASGQSSMSPEEQATLEEIKRRKQDGDEVILIVRSRRNPEIPSDVIVLNGTSEQFLEALVNSPAQPSAASYNSVIFSSHEPAQTTRQPVSFPVRH